jgi:sec-independent protein translocase protein TatB
MLGLDWTELALIAVVAVVVIGPKDLPDAVRGIAKGIQKLRRMAGEFQGHVDEVVREAKLEDVRNQINEIRSFDFRSAVEKEIDKDGSLRSTFRDDPIGNPLKDAFESKPAEGGAAVTPPPATTANVPPPPPPQAPAFIPPGTLPPLPVASVPPPPPPSAPAFVPPPPASQAPAAAPPPANTTTTV